MDVQGARRLSLSAPGPSSPRLHDVQSVEIKPAQGKLSRPELVLNGHSLGYLPDALMPKARALADLVTTLKLPVTLELEVRRDGKNLWVQGLGLENDNSTLSEVLNRLGEQPNGPAKLKISEARILCVISTPQGFELFINAASVGILAPSEISTAITMRNQLLRRSVGPRNVGISGNVLNGSLIINQLGFTLD